MLDGTPIYDIKPYIKYTDSHPDAKSSFAEEEYGKRLEVIIPDGEAIKLKDAEKEVLTALLEEDPRPSYQEDPEREYGMLFASVEVFFKVKEKTLTVTRIKEKS